MSEEELIALIDSDPDYWLEPGTKVQRLPRRTAWPPPASDAPEYKLSPRWHQP